MSKTSRLNRYFDKLNHAEHRTKNIEEWSKFPDLIDDERTLLAIYKAGQEVIESIMDLLAMMLKDLDKSPKDDYSNIKHAFEERLITSSERDLLRESNGLRNRLIHDYNGISDELALEALERLLPGMKGFLKKVRDWSQEFFK